MGINTGTIANDGVIITTGNVSNNGNFISGTSSALRLEGAQQNLNGSAPYTFNDLVIDGTDNKNLNVGASIMNNLNFNANKFIINNNNLILLQAATVTNSGYQKFVVTNGTGSLIKKALPTGNNFLFPVGDAISSFKPVIINPSGAVDTFAVRVINGITPSDQTSVQKTYIIKESTPLATTAEVTLGWNTVDEGTAFQSTQALMWQNVLGAWTSINTTPAGGSPNSPSTDWKYLANGVQFKSLAADSFILKSAAPPVINTQPQNITVCENGNAFFSVSATGLGLLSFEWQINCSGTWTPISNGGTNPMFAGANDSILTLTNVPFSNNGCLFRCIVGNIAGTTISNTATLTVHQAPLATITGDTAICEGDATTLSVQTLGTSYLWSTSELTQSIYVNPITNETYSVTVTDGNLCTSSASVNVQVTADFTVDITSDYAPENSIIQGQIATFTATPSTYDNYEFFVNGVSMQTSASNVFSTASIQDGNFITVVASVNECTSADSLKMTIKPISNAFTPFDKDNINDIFAKGVDLVVFNRWGQTLYEGNQGWDGTYKNEQVSYGTYYYKITMNKDKGLPETLTGTVTVISKNK